MGSEKPPMSTDLKNEKKDEMTPEERRMLERAGVKIEENQVLADKEQEPENQSSETETVSATLKKRKARPKKAEAQPTEPEVVPPTAETPEIQPQPKSELSEPENQPAETEEQKQKNKEREEKQKKSVEALAKDILTRLGANEEENVMAEEGIRKTKNYFSNKLFSPEVKIQLRNFENEIKAIQLKAVDQNNKEAFLDYGAKKEKLEEVRKKADTFLGNIVDGARDQYVRKESELREKFSLLKKILGDKNVNSDIKNFDLEFLKKRYEDIAENFASFRSMEESRYNDGFEEQPKEKSPTDKMDETLESEKINMAIAHEDAGPGNIKEDDEPEPELKRKKQKIQGIPLLYPLKWIAKKPKQAKDEAQELFTQTENRRIAAKKSQKTITPDTAANYMRTTQDPKRRAQWEREAQAKRALEGSEKKLRELEEKIGATEDPTEKERLEREKEKAMVEHKKISADKERLEFGQTPRKQGIRFNNAEQDTVRRLDIKIADLERQVKNLYRIEKGYSRDINLEDKIRQLQFERDVVLIRNFRKHVCSGDASKWNETKDKVAMSQIFNEDGSRNADNKLSDVYRLLELKLFPMVEDGNSTKRETVERSVVWETRERLEGKEPALDEKGNIIYPFRYTLTSEDLKPKENETNNAWIVRMVKLARDLDANIIPKKPIEKPEDDKEREKKKNADSIKEKIEKDYKEQKRRRGQGRQIKTTLGKLDDREQRNFIEMIESDSDSDEEEKKKINEIQGILIEKELSEKGLVAEYKKFLEGEKVKKTDKDGKEKETMKKPTQEEIKKFLKGRGIRVGEFTGEYIKDMSSKIKYLNQIGLAGLSRQQKINLIENNIPMRTLESVNNDILKRLSTDDRGILIERISRNVKPEEISRFVEERLPDGYAVRDENGERDSAVKQNFLAFLMATKRHEEQQAIDSQDDGSEEENGKSEGDKKVEQSVNSDSAGGGNGGASQEDDSSSDD